jgi:hypothetical protein
MTSKDDAATDAEGQLRKNIDRYPSDIRAGDIVIDLVEGRPLYVRKCKGTAVDVFENESFDLTTYKVHPWLPIDATDDVFECVFLPTKPADIPASEKEQTYSYPRGRLARVPVEHLYGSSTHRHDEQSIDVLVDLAEAFDRADAPDVVFEHFAEAVQQTFAFGAEDVPLPDTTAEEDDGLSDFDDFEDT